MFEIIALLNIKSKINCNLHLHTTFPVFSCVCSRLTKWSEWQVGVCVCSGFCGRRGEGGVACFLLTFQFAPVSCPIGKRKRARPPLPPPGASSPYITINTFHLLATCHGPGAADNYSLSSTAAAAILARDCFLVWRARRFPPISRSSSPRFNCETTSLIKFHWRNALCCNSEGEREVYFGIRRLLSRVSFLFCLRDAQEKVREKRIQNASNSALECSH